MRNHPARLLIGTLCVAAVIAPMPSANAASKFDGMWSAVFRTKSGPCQPAYRGAVQVVNGIIQIASTAGSLSGRVSRNGSVRATGYMGANKRRRIGTSFGQFRQRDLARSRGKRELRRRLDCAATIIAPANVGASAPQVPSRVRFSREFESRLPPVYG
jgi:hypothetical protein